MLKSMREPICLLNEPCEFDTTNEKLEIDIKMKSASQKDNYVSGQCPGRYSAFLIRGNKQLCFSICTVIKMKKTGFCFIFMDSFWYSDSLLFFSSSFLPDFLPYFSFFLSKMLLLLPKIIRRKQGHTVEMMQVLGNLGKKLY